MGLVQVRVKMRTGRGVGDDEAYFEQIMANYDSVKQEYDNKSQAERNQIKEKLNTFTDGLGDAFDQDKDAFTTEATDILDKGDFVDLMVGLKVCKIE